jgi:NAD-dependent deacetylase
MHKRMGDELSRNTEIAASMVGGATAITVLTGAGISTDSGLPDFRGPNGIWTKNPEAEKASNIANYVNEPEVRRANWALRAEGKLWANVHPNAGHRALLPLQERGVLHTLITQNVDELHQLAGIEMDRVVEIHGTTRKAGCLSCDYRTTMNSVLERVRDGEEDPACPNCDGIMKSATISFGQALIPEDLTRAQEAADAADLLLAIGSTLTVNPIASIVPRAKRQGAALVIVNAEPTPFDGIADVVVRGSISDVLPAIIGGEHAR